MVTFTPAAVQAALDALATADEPAVALRVSAEGGGCHGPRCGLGLEIQIDEGDTVLDFDGLTVVLDPASLTLLEGAIVDFVTDEDGAGFVFDNPAWRKHGGCGCGGRGHG